MYAKRFDCSDPPQQWSKLLPRFRADGFVVVTPCTLTKPMVDAVAAFTASGCSLSANATCEPKTNGWIKSKAVHDVAGIPELRSLIEYLHDGAMPTPLRTSNFYRPPGVREHSDAIFWDTLPRGRMVGSWIALEDVTPTSGPLELFAGSHREGLWDYSHVGLCKSYAKKESKPPRHQIPPSEVKFARAPADVQELSSATKLEWRWQSEWLSRSNTSLSPCSHRSLMKAYTKAMVAAFAGSNPYTALLKRGQVALWASSLVHRGREVVNRNTTRLSMITHYYFDSGAYWMPKTSMFGRIDYIQQPRLPDVFSGGERLTGEG